MINGNTGQDFIADFSKKWYDVLRVVMKTGQDLQKEKLCIG